MLDQTTRATVLRLAQAGHGSRAIAKALQLSRGAVRRVLCAGTDVVPSLARAEKAEAHEARVRELYLECQGNLVRVHEELLAAGARLSYQALTGFCRRHGIGSEIEPPAGRYEFLPGQEMQHDTSPHRAKMGGVERRVQTASMVLCFSRLLFVQAYPRFTRFECKLFLTDAVQYFCGSAKTCMVDNCNLVVQSGTGAGMLPVPEMAALGARLGFHFVAHEKGDANRSGRVERPMDYIENNFYAGRRFVDFDDLNRQARVWCDTSNATWRRHLHASPRELFAIEQPQLQPLPLHVPEVYLLHHRLVDVEGFVSVAGHRYSVPARLLGRQLEVRQTRDRILVFDGPRLVASHTRVVASVPARVLLPEHRVERPRRAPSEPSPEERALRQAGEEIAAYVDLLKRRLPGLRATLHLRRLLALLRDYPEAAFRDAVRTASHYGLVDLERLEGLILRSIHSDYFVLLPSSEDPDEEE